MPLVGMLGNRVMNWRQICEQCGVLPIDVEVIARTPLYLLGNYHTDCCTAGLKKWCSSGEKAMFSTFIRALRSRVVGEGALANEIIQRRHELPSAKHREDEQQEGMYTYSTEVSNYNLIPSSVKKSFRKKVQIIKYQQVLGGLLYIHS